MKPISTSASKPLSRLDRLIFAALVGMLMLPVLGHAAKAAGLLPLPENTENRVLATAPDCPTTLARLEDLPEELDAWVKDNTGGRATLIRLQGQMTGGLGGVSNDQVILGRDDWAFINVNGTIASYGGTRELPANALGCWYEAVIPFADEAGIRGIPMASIIVPNKHRIYFDRLPAALGAPSDRRLYSDIQADPRRAEIGLVDIEPDLLQNKERQQLYFRSDSHWTRNGAYYAYAALLQRLKPGTEPATTRDNVFADYSGDLNKMAGYEIVSPDTVNDIVPQPRARRLSYKDDTQAIGGAAYAVTESEYDVHGGDTLVIIGDSFAPYLELWISQHYSRVVRVHHTVALDDASYVWDQNPDAIVFEMVERLAEEQALTCEQSD